MSQIEMHTTIDLPDNADPSAIIEQLRNLLSAANGKETRINVVEIDHPMSVNPIYMSKNLGE